jgi:hypothetical protein
MPGYYTLKYRDGRSEEYFGHRGYYYVLSGGRLVSFNPDPVWCHTCKRVTLGEQVRTRAEVEEELRQIEDQNSEWYRAQRRAPRAEDVAAWKKLLNALVLLWDERTSPAKCMTCFQPTVSQFVWGKWQPHPGTGEEIFYECTGMCSTDFAMRFFTPNCEELSLSKAEEEKFFAMIRKGAVL